MSQSHPAPRRPGDIVLTPCGAVYALAATDPDARWRELARISRASRFRPPQSSRSGGIARWIERRRLELCTVLGVTP